MLQRMFKDFNPTVIPEEPSDDEDENDNENEDEEMKNGGVAPKKEKEPKPEKPVNIYQDREIFIDYLIKEHGLLEAVFKEF